MTMANICQLAFVNEGHGGYFAGNVSQVCSSEDVMACLCLFPKRTSTRVHFGRKSPQTPSDKIRDGLICRVSSKGCQSLVCPYKDGMINWGQIHQSNKNLL